MLLNSKLWVVFVLSLSPSLSSAKISENSLCRNYNYLCAPIRQESKNLSIITLFQPPLELLMDTMQQLVPPWLEQLLHTSFFWVCNTHGDAARSECNMFCLDCGGDAFCFYCRSSSHKDHQVIQIRRSSYHDVVRVSEVQRAIDISGVQTYVINSARVMFLNERPQPKSAGSKGVSHLCEICGRSLLDPFRFCSLGCKLVGIKRNGNASFSLESKNEVVGRGDQGISNRRVLMNPSSSTDHQIQQGSDELRGGSEQATFPHMSPPPGRRRKGIPHRAPFAS